MKRASIIIPVFNTEKLLERCLNSVIIQDYSDFEVICIDDCSTDGSVTILKKFESQYRDKLKVLYNSENIGQGLSRMKGIKASSGNYIFFVDSDDYIDEHYISTYMSYVLDEAYDVVVGGFIQDDEGTLKKYQVEPTIWSIVSYSHACCKLYSRDFIIDNNIDFGCFRKGEDIYFSLLLVLHGAKHKFIDYCGYYYYVNHNSTTKSMSWGSNFECVVSDMFTKLLSNIGDIDYSMQQFLEYAYMAGMVNALITYGHGCKMKIMKRKYGFFIEDIHKKFPNIKKNKMIYKLHFEGPTIKCRVGVFVTAFAMRMHIDKVLYAIISLV